MIVAMLEIMILYCRSYNSIPKIHNLSIVQRMRIAAYVGAGAERGALMGGISVVVAVDVVGNPKPVVVVPDEETVPVAMTVPEPEVVPDTEFVPVADVFVAVAVAEPEADAEDEPAIAFKRAFAAAAIAAAFAGVLYVEFKLLCAPTVISMYPCPSRLPAADGGASLKSVVMVNAPAITFPTPAAAYVKVNVLLSERLNEIGLVVEAWRLALAAALEQSKRSEPEEAMSAVSTQMYCPSAVIGMPSTMENSVPCPVVGTSFPVPSLVNDPDGRRNENGRPLLMAAA